MFEFFRILSMTPTALLLLLVSGCGGDKNLNRPDKKNNPAQVLERNNANANLRRSLLEADPAIMSSAELQMYLSRLSARDAAETREMTLLTAINTDLCERLQNQRSDCSSMVRIIPDGSETILGCSGQLTGNSSINHSIKATLAEGEGSFFLSAEKLFKSTSFSIGTTDVSFRSYGDTTTKAPRFMDLTSIRLVPKNKVLPSLETVGFELEVNENVLFTSSDLIASDNGEFYKINPAALIGFRDSDECSVSAAEIQEIRTRVMSSLSQNQNSTPTTSDLK